MKREEDLPGKHSFSSVSGSYTEPNSNFVEELCAIPGGEKIRLCLQCGTCSGSCPMAKEMQYTPRQIFAMVKAGMREEVLSSDSIWYCVSCYLCTVRCPQGIRQTDIMYALKRLAIQYGLHRRAQHEPKLSKSFVAVVNRYGRNFETELLARYYLKTNPFGLLRLLPFGLKLMKRGRLPLSPSRIEQHRQFKALIDKASLLGVQ